MKLERWLQINTALLAFLGTLLLGLGQGDTQLALLVFFAAITSVVFTDALKWFQLNRYVANFFALVAAAFALNDFFESASEDQLLAIANLLVYLQFVLLYQRKTERIYWQLIVLTLLQVVVAAALNLQAGSGLLLVAYAVAAMTALLLFYVYREVSRFERQADGAASRRRRRNTRGGQRLEGQPMAHFAGTAKSAVQALLNWGLFRQLIAMSWMTVLFTFVLFYAVPRSGDSIWMGPQKSRPPTADFTRNVDLNGSGRIRLSNKPVMRVSLTNYFSGQTYRTAGEIYYRGTILTRYSPDDSQWTVGRSRGSKRIPEPLTATDNVVRQDIVLAANNHDVLFAVYPSFAVEGGSPGEVWYDLHKEALQRPEIRDTRRAPRYRYALTTTGFRQGRQFEAVPARRFAGSEYLDMLECPFDSISRASDKIVQDANVDRTNPVAVATALKDYFLLSGEFQYSLNYVRSDESLDPIEDFLLNHRTAHCEFYAAALTMMLRSQGIPARMVIGFKGGEFNSVGNYHHVLQKHAHAWVEAHIPPEHVDETMLAAGSDTQHGVWLRLDGTPFDSQFEETEGESKLIAKLDEFLDYFGFIWDDYVMGLDSSQQQKSLYDPLSERADAVDRSGLKAFFVNFAEALGIDTTNIGRLRNWLNWRLALVVVLIIFAAVSIYRSNLRLKATHGKLRLGARLLGLLAAVARLFRWRSGSQSPMSRTSSVEFYERFAKLLQKSGLRRPAHQTQREFARAVCDRFESAESTGTLAPLLHQIIDAFYRVRFGGAALDDGECQTLENALVDLEVALATHHLTQQNA